MGGLKYVVKKNPSNAISKLNFQIRRFQSITNLLHLSVISVAFTTQINSGNTCLHCTRSLIKKRIWWEGNKFNIYFIFCNFVGPCLVTYKNHDQILVLDINIYNNRLQMFGLVGLPYMWCWLVLIHLKILMIQ